MVQYFAHLIGRATLFHVKVQCQESSRKMIYFFTAAFGLICIFNPIVLSNIHAEDIQIKHNDIKLGKLNLNECHCPKCALNYFVDPSCNDNEDEFDKYSRLKNQPITKTNFGDVQGQIEMFNNDEVVAYYGIRYAKPPLGVLRFKKPEQMDEDTIMKFGLQSKEKVACVQPKNFLIGDDLGVSEDCLHLNIWVPLVKGSVEDINSGEDIALPVMIWIHGGSFHIGSGYQDEFNGIVLSSIGNVVVVTLNYRLGFFGFLNAGLESAPGNVGLYDQAAAIKWVKETIRNFGGDQNQITVFGESAGGMSVGLLTVSPYTRHLFNRAIIESGSPYSPLRPEAKTAVFKKSLVFSKTLNCSHPDAEEFDESTMNCLRSIDYEIIDNYGKNEVMHSQILPNPIFGDDFIPADVHMLMKNPDNINKNLEVLLGINRDEGFFFVFQQLRHLLDTSISTVISKEDAYSEVKKLLKGRPVDPVEVSDYYFRNFTFNEDSISVLNTIMDLYGDLYINCPVYFLAKRYKDILGYANTNTYMLTKASGKSYMAVCKDWLKVCHADEIVLVFGVPLRKPQEFNEPDKKLSEDFVQLWTEFARTGLVYKSLVNRIDNSSYTFGFQKSSLD